MSKQRKTPEVLSGFVSGGLSVFSLSVLLAESLTSSLQGTASASDEAIDNLKAEALKQEILMGAQLHQAKVEQEQAIAQRIANAEEVEIEEYYDLAGTASLGLSGSLDTSEINLGAKGSGRKVTKRIYRFKGKAGVEENSIQIEPPKE
jgi:hypothetical protein